MQKSCFSSLPPNASRELKKQISTSVWSEQHPMAGQNTIALILWQLGYGLRTFNTLSQVTGYPTYGVFNQHLE